MNAYEVKAGWYSLQVKLCDPCLSASKWFVPCKALYKCSAFSLCKALQHRCNQRPIFHHAPNLFGGGEGALQSADFLALSGVQEKGKEGKQMKDERDRG